VSAAEPVTLRRHDGDWQVTRGSQRWTPPVYVRRGIDGWLVTHRGIGVSGFPRLRDVRTWLDSPPDGARWLDSLDGAP
jgi:hypothetical protein